MPPLVSVLLPVLDAGMAFSACLESVRRQGLEDFECVVVDDGSTDGSAETAARTAGRDSRFVSFAHSHRGLIETLNAGLERCRGEYVARMDADDWMHSGRLAAQVAALDADPTLDLVGCHVRFFPRTGLGQGSREYERWLNSFDSATDVRRERFIECPLAHPTWMLRRTALERLDGYRDQGWPEDYDLLLRLIEGGGRAGVVPRRLLGWGQHTGRLSRKDPRYTLDAFTACRAHFLASGPLRAHHRYLLWGYGQTGRALRRALAGHGKQLSGLIEVHPGRLGQKIHGAPVVAPEEIDRLPRHPLLVSVAGAGPRNEIRDKLRGRGRQEGRDFFCAA